MGLSGRFSWHGEVHFSCEAVHVQLQEAEARLRTLRSGSTLITAEERQAVEKAFLAYTDAWNKRKRVFKSIWSARA